MDMWSFLKMSQPVWVAFQSLMTTPTLDRGLGSIGDENIQLGEDPNVRRVFWRA
jgi:hypothetical protein